MLILKNIVSLKIQTKRHLEYSTHSACMFMTPNTDNSDIKNNYSTYYIILMDEIWLIQISLKCK